MKRPPRSDEGPSLFDLPLKDTPPAAGSQAAPSEEPSLDEAAILDLTPDGEGAPRVSSLETPPQQASPGVSPRRAPARVRKRVVGGLADLVVHAGVLAGALGAMSLMGIDPRLEHGPGLATFLGVFSFLYTVIPLAFWGQTPGMSWARLLARDHEDRPLTFGQTALRWVGAFITVLFVGLPLLIALTGRSLADRVSGSNTYQEL